MESGPKPLRRLSCPLWTEQVRLLPFLDYFFQLHLAERRIFFYSPALVIRDLNAYCVNDLCGNITPFDVGVTASKKNHNRPCFGPGDF
jgi:hypothetical protein